MVCNVVTHKGGNEVIAVVVSFLHAQSYLLTGSGAGFAESLRLQLCQKRVTGTHIDQDIIELATTRLASNQCTSIVVVPEGILRLRTKVSCKTTVMQLVSIRGCTPTHPHIYEYIYIHRHAHL